MHPVSNPKPTPVLTEPVLASHCSVVFDVLPGKATYLGIASQMFYYSVHPQHSWPVLTI